MEQKKLRSDEEQLISGVEEMVIMEVSWLRGDDYTGSYMTAYGSFASVGAETENEILDDPMEVTFLVTSPITW